MARNTVADSENTKRGTMLHMRQLADRLLRSLLCAAFVVGLMPALALAEEARDAEGGALTAQSAAEGEGGLSPQADDTPTPGWSRYGACEWKVEGKTLTIRPLGNGSSGAIGTRAFDQVDGQLKHPWYNQRASIEKVVIARGVSANQDSAYLFYGLYALREADLSNLDTSKASDMRSMFQDCSSLTNLDLSAFDTSSATYMREMFAGCTSLANLSLSSFNTAAVTNMRGMFSNCVALSTLDISHFKMSEATDLTRMFAGCTSLTTVKLPNAFIGGKCKYINYLFYGCPNFTIIPENFTFGPSPSALNKLDAFKVADVSSPVITYYYGSDANVAAYNWAADNRALVVDDQTAAAAVDAKIAAIGAVTLGSGEAIEEARVAYGKLNAVQMSLTKLVPQLTLAMNQYDWLKANVGEKLERLAGKTRYDTMLDIVKRSFEKYDGKGPVPSADSVVVALGTNFPDALSASALAGVHNAPIVLTDGATLSPQAVEAIEYVGAKHIYVVGGEKAIYPAVYQKLRDIAHKKNGGSIERIAGATRTETATKIFEHIDKVRGDRASTAIVVSGVSYADALSIGSYAYAHIYPLFLADEKGNLDEATLKVMEKGDFKQVLIVGGKAVVSEDAEKTLRSRVCSDVIRYGGANRFETTIRVANLAINEGMQLDGMVVANGANFPDALAAAPLAGRHNSVTLLVDRSDKGKQPITDVIKLGASVIKGLTIAGGTSAVPTEVENAIKTALGVK